MSPGLCPVPHWRSLQHSFRPPSWWGGWHPLPRKVKNPILLGPLNFAVRHFRGPHNVVDEWMAPMITSEENESDVQSFCPSSQVSMTERQNYDTHTGNSTAANNKVTLHQVQLLLRSMTMQRYTILVNYQLSRHSASYPQCDGKNDWWPKCCTVL